MIQFKKVLFIAPNFFNYSLLIKHELESMGAVVDYFSNKPNSNSSKIIEIFSSKIYQKIKNRYFKKLSRKISNNYEFVLIIRPDIIPNEFLNIVKTKNPNSKYIQYIWDDIKLFPKILDTIKYFDKTFSYDIIDSEEYGLLLRPFFFVELFEDDKKVDYTCNNELFFIGSFHTDRVQVLEKIKKMNPDIKLYHHLYINPLVFLVNKIPLSKRKLFKFHKMNYIKMVKTINKSVAILDIQNNSQHGLTTRIFEALGAKTKIVTTNCNIMKYEFYNTNNILIVDRNNPLIDKSWFNLPYHEYDKNIYEKYNIRNWINEVFIFE